jgi:hypothetical protein
MRATRKILVVAALAGFAVLGTAGPALATPTSTPVSSAQLVGVVHQTGPTTAEVMARYTCTGTPDQLHLWVSVKQTEDRTADPRLAMEGSSQISAAWSQSHAGVLTCDGKNHVASFTVDQSEQGFGTLAKGDAWVQFCMFDATTPEPMPPTSDMEFMHVR